MPKYQPTTIAYKESGLIKDRQAFVTPNDAYVQLDNAYVWRGICKRRLGYETLGRLRRQLTDETDDIDGVAMSYDPPSTGSQDIDIFTVYGINSLEPNASLQKGSAGSSLVVILDDGGGNETILTDSTGTGTMVVTGGSPIISSATIDYATGIITAVFTSDPGAVSVTLTMGYYPCLPVMGIRQRELNTINEEDTIFFDTRYAYVFLSSQFTEWIPGTNWLGGNVNFFWTTNYWNSGTDKLFWATNFFPNVGGTGDPIRYTDGTTWTDFAPDIDAAGPNNKLQQCLMLIPYRGRLVALNTYEGTTLTSSTQTANRARWSQNGDPTDQTNGWLSNVQGRGGFVDAPTNEHIVTAGFIRDTLIVYFERSSWKLRYTGNEILPFVWERINIELGAESTFSIVRFDKGILTVGDKAITTCDGNYVERIDNNIRDEVFKIHNGNNGVKRVHGIRDFFEQVVYWVFPAAEEDPIYPNRVLLYNYDNGTWAFFRDSFTAVGTFQRVQDLRWSDLVGVTWEEFSRAWNSGQSQSQFPLIVGGNQQGYVQIFQQKVGNDPSLHISAIATGTPPTITSADHNLEEGEVVELSGIEGTSSILNGFRYRVSSVTQNTFQLESKPKYDITAVNLANNTVTAVGNTLSVGDLVQFAGIVGTTELNGRTATVVEAGNTFTIDIDISGFTAYVSDGTAEDLNELFQDAELAGGSTYIGCGEITKVSNFSIRSKKFNMLNQGRKTQLGFIDFLCDVTDSGQVSVPIFIDYNDSQPVNPRGGDAFFNSSISTKTGAFSTVNQEKEWHRFYSNVEGQFFQYELTLDEPQLISKEIQESVFNTNAVIIWHERGSRLT